MCVKTIFKIYTRISISRACKLPQNSMKTIRRVRLSNEPESKDVFTRPCATSNGLRFLGLFCLLTIFSLYCILKEKNYITKLYKNSVFTLKKIAVIKLNF